MNTKDIWEKVYGVSSRILIEPHVVNYIPKLNKRNKTTDTVNIGLLGDLTAHKGSSIVREMLGEISQQQLNVRIVLIGNDYSEMPNSAHFKTTGRYEQSELPSLTLKNDIDIYFIPSIWPETFSFTTEEAIKMDIPVACFDIGAPAERVVVYNKGIVLYESNVRYILEQILEIGRASCRERV